MNSLLIIGSGDVARRALPGLLEHYRVICLVRDAADAAPLRALGAWPVIGDLDRPASLKPLGRMAALATHILHFAPPQNHGDRDERTRNLLHVLTRWARWPRDHSVHLSGPSHSPRPPRCNRAKSLAQRFVYISTSGVYGDCKGEPVVETRPCAAQTARAQRRVDAERVLRRFGGERGVHVTILRAPGIYAEDRLPLARLQAATPVLVSGDDVYTNHIHADDLARAAVAALRFGQPGRTYNVSDDSGLKMGDYLDQVADHFSLPHPSRISRGEAERQLNELQMSFLRESRRLCNDRLKKELRFRFKYPTVADCLRAMQADPADGGR